MTGFGIAVGFAGYCVFVASVAWLLVGAHNKIHRLSDRVNRLESTYSQIALLVTRQGDRLDKIETDWPECEPDAPSRLMMASDLAKLLRDTADRLVPEDKP